MFDSLFQRTQFATIFSQSQWSEPYTGLQDEEFYTPLKESPSKTSRDDNEFPCKDSKKLFGLDDDDERVWIGHTRIVMNLNHLINMPAGPGWTELHIQPSDTLQVQ